jgi:DNA-damage-inducible protein J
MFVMRDLDIGVFTRLTISQLRYIIVDIDEIRKSDMNPTTSMIHIRVDDETKEQASEALASMGLSMSDAVRLFLRRVVIDQAFPLELKVPNAETQAAMAESRKMMKSRRSRFSSADALFDDLEKKRNK